MSEINPEFPEEKITSITPGAPHFVSYAQNAEDVMLKRALYWVDCGFYVDVGAGEPEADSVTHAFYQRGWRGINLEPASGAFERLSSARPRDINLNVAAGDQNGMLDFFLVDDGNGLSTAVTAQMENLRKQGWHSTVKTIPVLTLSSILEKCGETEIHFLKIDVEGSERAVLAGADLYRFRPWIILVEATAPNTQEPTHQEWEDILVSANYHFVWFDGLNRFYLSTEKLDLMPSFRVQPNVFDNFVRHTEVEIRVQLEQTRVGLVEAVAREQSANATLQAAETGLVEQRSRENMLRDEVSHLVTERDAWMQESGKAIAREQKANAALQIAQTELVEQRSRENILRDEVSHLVTERDAWMQELFETNRYAADLTQARQTLLHNKEELEGERVRLLDEIHRLKSDKIQISNQIYAMYASTSWKFSRPVRAVGKLLGRP